jgi:sigma54-dependent transcription regulator
MPRRKQSGAPMSSSRGTREKAAILASFNTQCFRRPKEEEQEFFNDANFDHVVEISRQQATTEEAGRLLMVAKRQNLLELNAQRQAEAAARD